jgi:phosphatidylserine/phosphatidylglycerophosphate/cardiolipin synthase-like enzyme
MTPFIDAGGFRWLRRVFEATHADCQRIAVLRNTDQYSVELGVQHAEWLRAMQVSVRDYHLSHAATAGRALPIETFHAKLIVADDTLAYVGSANLLSSSEGLSLETGLLVEGGAAAQVARLVDAVLRVARSLLTTRRSLRKILPRRRSLTTLIG